MALITNERLRQILDAQSTFVDLFMVKGMEALLESQLGAGAVDDILDDMIPEEVSPQTVMFGHKLGDYSGLNRATIKAKFTKPDGSALLDADVDAIFAALGVVSGTSAPLGGGAEEQEQAEGQGADEESKTAGKEVEEPKATKKSAEDNKKNGGK